jgi:hypothetical protein
MEKPNFHDSECPECGFSSMQKGDFSGSGKLGSAPGMAAIVDNPKHEQAFMGHDARHIGSDILEDFVEVRPAWPNPRHTAPELERAGNS